MIGVALCQARSASNAPLKEYLAEGEYVPGTTPQTLYYGVDQLESVRRVFASPSASPAFDYDAFGNALQSGGSLADFAFAQMVGELGSGLELATYPAYDPRLGRWISRDPLLVQGALPNNLYLYGTGSPLNQVDPTGLYTLQIGFSANVSILFFSAQLSAGFAIDNSGTLATYYLGGLGGGSGVTGFEGSGGLSLALSSAPTVCGLGGPFNNYSLGGGAGEGGSFDVFTDPSNPVIGAGITLGLGLGAGGSAMKTDTLVHPLTTLW